MDALSLLNSDCWWEIFQRVADKSDWKNLAETCLAFKELLERNRNSWVFILALPHVNPYMSWTHRWECRLVCRDWCRAIDKTLESKVYDRFQQVYNFVSGERIAEFMGVFGNHSGNPFIGRNIMIMHRRTLFTYPRQGHVQNEDEAYYNSQVLKLLQKFGSHIATLYFSEGVANQHLTYCQNIQILISRLPNLKKLIFDDETGYRWRFRRCLPILDASDQQEGITNLANFLTENPIPNLPLLEHLDVSHVTSKFIGPLLERNSSHLKVLVLHDLRPFSSCVRGFRCLKKLDIIVEVSNTLGVLRELQSPLEILHLYINISFNNTDFWHIDELFRNIQHLPIKTLKIRSLNFVGESAPIDPDLQLRSIKRISLNWITGRIRLPSMAEIVYKPGISFNFLNCLPNVEEINIWTFIIVRYPHPEAIPTGHPHGIPETFFLEEPLLENQLYTSDVWNRIPTLKKMSQKPDRGVEPIPTFNFTRDGYEQWRLKQTEKFFRGSI